MKIIKDNYNLQVQEEYDVVCEHCGSELTIEQYDIEYREFGLPYAKCLCCENYIDLSECYDIKGITLTESNIEFPTHFYHFAEPDAVDINDDKIKEWIQQVVHYLRNNPSEFSAFVGSGNSMVFAFNMKDDEEYSIVVTKDYYETYIPYKEIDYERNNNH